MNKEQDEFKLVRILNKYFDDTLLETLSECANEIIQAGYVQLQADSDRVVSKAVSEALSANNAKWREKIKAELSTYCNMIKQYPDAPIGSMAEEVIKTLESILSQMEGE